MSTFSQIAANSEDDGLFLSPTEVEGWFRLGLRVNGDEALFLTVTLNETGVTGVSFNSVTSPHVYTNSDAAPELPPNHVVVNS